MVGSSTISTLGRKADTLAIITRWRVPPESSSGYWSSGARVTIGALSVNRADVDHDAADTQTGADGIGQLKANAYQRVKAGQIFLKDYSYAVAANGMPVAIGQAGQGKRTKVNPAT